MSALPPPSPSETPAEPPRGRRHPVREFIVAKGALWIGGVLLLAIVGVVLFVAGGGRSQGAPENDAFRGFFNDHRATVCPVYVEAKMTLGLEVAEDTALELLEDAYSGTWQEALSTEALRMLDSCEAVASPANGKEEAGDASDAPPDPQVAPDTTAPPVTEPPATASPATEPPARQETTPTTTSPIPATGPTTTFADLAAAADDVLGPLEMADGTRIAVFAHHARNLVHSDGSIILAVEGPTGWDVRQEIVPDATPASDGRASRRGW